MRGTIVYTEPCSTTSHLIPAQPAWNLNRVDTVPGSIASENAQKRARAELSQVEPCWNHNFSLNYFEWLPAYISCLPRNEVATCSGCIPMFFH